MNRNLFLNLNYKTKYRNEKKKKPSFVWSPRNTKPDIPIWNGPPSEIRRYKPIENKLSSKYKKNQDQRDGFKRITCYSVSREATAPREVNWRGKHHIVYKPRRTVDMTIHPDKATSVNLNISFTSGAGNGYKQSFYLPIWNKVKENKSAFSNGGQTFSTYRLKKPVYMGNKKYNKIVNVINRRGHLIESRFYS